MRELYVEEIFGNRAGTSVRVPLDEAGIGYLPNALAGSALALMAYGWTNAGAGLERRRLEVRLGRQEAR